MRLNSLAFRLFATAAALAILVLPVTAVVLVSIYRGAVERNFDARLALYLTNLVAASAPPGATRPDEPRSLGEPLFERPFSGWYWQITPIGQPFPLYTSSSLLDAVLELPSASGAPANANHVRQAYVAGPENQRLRILEREVTLGQGETRSYSYAVAGDAADMQQDIQQFTTLLIAALSVLGVGLVAATLVQVRFGLRPLRAIQAGLAAIRSGEALALEGEYPSEILPLQQELNALIRSNRELVERARTHVGNLAHALKTPLSVITNEARGSDAPLAAKVAEQAEIMRRQISHHLDRARMAARIGVIGTVTDVGETAGGLVRTLQRIYKDRDLSITLTCPPGCRFQGERQDLEEMLGNLLDNACKWAASRVAVGVDCLPGASEEAGGRRLVITVDDDGPGLSQEERAAAVQRGKRLDESKPGSGLGLSIVADLAHLYKGSLTLEAAPGRGLRARLDLPAI